MDEKRQTGIEDYRRYAIYAVPEGALYDRTAAWLGWDSLGGREIPPQKVPGLLGPADAMTGTPRRYGIHGTIKPPFRLAVGHDAEALRAAFAAFCATRAPVTLSGLAVRRLGGFVALLPETRVPALDDLAAATVAALDDFRAPPQEAELARRRKSGLTDRQEALLTRWGYPYVMEEFRFHMTLTGRLPAAEADRAVAALAEHLAPVLPRPWPLDSLCLLGEAQDGRFHVLCRCRLGPAARS
jgi:putative phosphonate metabolism protein